LIPTFEGNIRHLINTVLNERLEKRLQENSFRKLTVNPDLIDFTSNDYLGFARSEELFKRINDRTESLPHRNGATGSRLLSGNSAYTEAVEKKLACIFKSEAALIFNSGYTANQAVLSSIPQKGDTIIYDEYAHACIRDGARLSYASRFSFIHNNVEDLEKKLKIATGNIFIVVESIYSMDGDECPLFKLTELADQYNALIILDEAHSTGVMGATGSGLAVTAELEDKIAVRIYTFGKAMGVHGACVAGSQKLIEYLINFARPFIYTTAPAPHSIAAIECSFEYLSGKINLQAELKQKIELFVSLCKQYNIITSKSNSQIQGIIVSGNDTVKRVAAALQHKGFDIRPILSPTVPKDMERLRICLHSYNTTEEITRLVKELATIIP
jgi:8-amino-7-oxononanoate synthase